MMNDEKLISMFEEITSKLNKIEVDISELNNDVKDIKQIQKIHTSKLDAIELSINLQLRHSANLSERLNEVERKVMY